jgi:hypothetical protein
MATLDPDRRRKPRKTPKGHDTPSLGPSDSSDSGSDVVGTSDTLRPGQDIDVDRVVGAGEAGLGSGLDQAEEARRGEIAENAYYRAEKRGFTPGEEERDWLEAEAEIKARGKKRQKS